MSTTPKIYVNVYKYNRLKKEHIPNYTPQNKYMKTPSICIRNIKPLWLLSKIILKHEQEYREHN